MHGHIKKCRLQLCVLCKLHGISDLKLFLLQFCNEDFFSFSLQCYRPNQTNYFLLYPGNFNVNGQPRPGNAQFMQTRPYAGVAPQRYPMMQPGMGPGGYTPQMYPGQVPSQVNIKMGLAGVKTVLVNDDGFTVHATIPERSYAGRAASSAVISWHVIPAHTRSPSAYWRSQKSFSNCGMDCNSWKA